MTCRKGCNHYRNNSNLIAQQWKKTVLSAEVLFIVYVVVVLVANVLPMLSATVLSLLSFLQVSCSCCSQSCCTLILKISCHSLGKSTTIAGFFRQDKKSPSYNPILQIIQIRSYIMSNSTAQGVWPESRREVPSLLHLHFR